MFSRNLKAPGFENLLANSEKIRLKKGLKETLMWWEIFVIEFFVLFFLKKQQTTDLFLWNNGVLRKMKSCLILLKCGEEKATLRAGMFWTRVGMHGVRLPNTFQTKMDEAELKKIIKKRTRAEGALTQRVPSPNREKGTLKVLFVLHAKQQKPKYPPCRKRSVLRRLLPFGLTRRSHWKIFFKKSSFELHVWR